MSSLLLCYHLVMWLMVFSIVSCKGTASFTVKLEYECAELFHLCLNAGTIVVALKSKAEIGSPKYRIRLGLVLVSDVTLLAKSLDTSLPTSAAQPIKTTAPLKPIAKSTVVPMANPPATPPATISSLTIFLFNDGLDMLPDTVGAPKVLD